MNMAVAPNSISMKITSIVDVSMSEATVQITAASGKGYASLAKRGYKHFAMQMRTSTLTPPSSTTRERGDLII
jgi:hypothetical protein